MEVLFWDALVFSQYSFCLIPKVLDAIEVVFPDGIFFAVIDALVMEF